MRLMENLAALGESLGLARRMAQEGRDMAHTVTPERQRLADLVAEALATLKVVDQTMAAIREVTPVVVDQVDEANGKLAGARDLMDEQRGKHARSAVSHLSAAEQRLGGVPEWNLSWRERIAQLNDFSKGVDESTGESRVFLESMGDTLGSTTETDEISEQTAAGIADIEQYAAEAGAPLEQQ